jgi:FlaA1/EpsC-like NDP-sugar epimerase
VNDWITNAHPVLLGMVFAALLVTTVISGALPIVYHWQTRGLWRNSRVARHMMSLSVCLFAMLVFTVFSPFISSVNALLAVSLVLYATLSTLQVNQMRLIIRAQKARREKDTILYTQEHAENDDDGGLPEPP